MNIIDRFSTHLRDVLVKSIKIATELKSKTVEPVHILFALSLQKGSLATEILDRYNIDQKKIEKAIIENPEGQEIEEFGLSAFSEESKTLLERAMAIAQKNGHNYLGTEHLLAAILYTDKQWIHQFFSKKNLKASELEDQIKIVLSNSSNFPQVSEAPDAMDKMQDGISEDIMPLATILEDDRKPKKKDSALEFFAVNLTDKKIQSDIDPVIGREIEIERMMQILCRRTKNNPVLLGDPGVGKTAIVEGLAKKIMSGEVPEILLNKKIFSLDMGMLIAGTTYRGEFEARLKQVIEEITRDPNIILFIDEIHNIVGAGSNQGTMDAANLLKPALARGRIHCIGATTPAEFKKYIESDAALERRFQPIQVRESSAEDTIKILRGIKSNYEKYHNLKITENAIKTAALLADRYITNKFMPDKAIDLLDETASAKKLKVRATEAQTKLWKLQQELNDIAKQKEEAAMSDNFEKALKLKEKENTLKHEVALASASISKKNIAPSGIITEKDIYVQLSKMLNLKVTDLTAEENEKINIIEDSLKKSIVGQDAIIEDICRFIKQSQLGLSSTTRPRAAFMFVGESGVGKTELAKQISSLLYPSQNALIHLNMGEFSESFGVSKMLGSPAGYVGYKDQNIFTDKLKLNPYSVVLLDEVEKANKDVIKLLQQMLENGEVTDSTGKKISLRHAIIILTSAVGADELKKKNIGFGASQNQDDGNKRIVEKLKEFFSSELINRIDQVFIFNSLGKNELSKIAALEIDELNSKLKNYQTEIQPTAGIFEWFVEKHSAEKQASARDIRRKIRMHIEELVADIIINKKTKSSHKLAVKGEKLIIR